MAASPPIPQTALTFGYPHTLIAQTDAWSILTRPKQVTLGSLVLVCRTPATAFGAIPPQAFTDLGNAVPRIERMLRGFCSYEKINYLMLMMVDPDVHFHVFPRYAAPRTYAEQSFPDAGWPGPPALSEAVALDAETLSSLTASLTSLWDAEAGTDA